jgi:hypothetical protein
MQARSFPSTFGLLMLLAFATLAVAMLIGPRMAAMATDLQVDLSNGHPVERHGTSVVERVNRCFREQGTFAILTRSDGRRAEICRTEDGKFAIRILEENGTGGWRMVTEFIKEKMRTLDEVFRYLGNSGFTPLQ